MAKPGYGKRRMPRPRWMPDVRHLNLVPVQEKQESWIVMSQAWPGGHVSNLASGSWNDVSAYESRKEKKGGGKECLDVLEERARKKILRDGKKSEWKGWELSDDEVDIGERVDDGIDAWIHIYCLRSSPFSDSLKRNLYKKQINRHNLVWSGELCAWEWHKRPWKNILRRSRDAESVLYLQSREANIYNFMQEKHY